MPSAWYITAPAIVKFPQIKNMLAAGSAAGLSAASVYTETFMYCCNVAYFVRKDLADNGIVDNFQEYGENVNLTLQNLIIIALMWRCTFVSMNTFLLFRLFFLQSSSSRSRPPLEVSSSCSTHSIALFVAKPSHFVSSLD